MIWSAQTRAQNIINASFCGAGESNLAIERRLSNKSSTSILIPCYFLILCFILAQILENHSQ